MLLMAGRHRGQVDTDHYAKTEVITDTLRVFQHLISARTQCRSAHLRTMSSHAESIQFHVIAQLISSG